MLSHFVDLLLRTLKRARKGVAVGAEVRTRASQRNPNTEQYTHTTRVPMEGQGDESYCVYYWRGNVTLAPRRVQMGGQVVLEEAQERNENYLGAIN